MVVSTAHAQECPPASLITQRPRDRDGRATLHYRLYIMAGPRGAGAATRRRCIDGVAVNPAFPPSPPDDLSKVAWSSRPRTRRSTRQPGCPPNPCATGTVTPPSFAFSSIHSAIGPPGSVPACAGSGGTRAATVEGELRAGESASLSIHHHHPGLDWLSRATVDLPRRAILPVHFSQLPQCRGHGTTVGSASQHLFINNR